MVITEDDGGSTLKSTTPLQQSMGLTDSEATLRLPPSYQVTPAVFPTSPTYLTMRDKSRREPACRRFSKAVCIAIAVYILLGMVIHSFMILGEGRLVDGIPTGPRKADGRILSCANQTWGLQAAQIPAFGVPPYTSTSSFHIPVSTSHMFLFSRGSYGHGTIKMEVSDQSDGKIEVEVRTHYHTLNARNRANICHLEREGGGQGIGIYTPRRLYPFPRHSDQILFDIIIRFPKSGSTEHPLVINSVETNMGIWSHDVVSLENRVMFKSLSLSCSNTYIRANSVSAEFAQLTTSNGQITGSYNVSQSLSLKTSNAAITVALWIANNDGHKATGVEMKTSNGRIESPITLISSTNSTTHLPAAFSVIAKTSNSPITLSFPNAPSSPFSNLELDAKTSNAAANIKLHSTYEGSISLKTSAFPPSLVQKSSPPDPSGKGRHRNLEIRKVLGGALEAVVWWGDRSSKEGKGTVVVETSNAQNILELN